MDIKVNGVWLSTFCLVYDVKKDILPPREWTSIKIPLRAGAYLFNKQIDMRSIEVEVRFVGDVETKRQAMAGILESDDLYPIEFEDRIGIEYYGVFVGDSVLDREAHTATTTLQFLVPDPYGYGPEQTAAIASGNETGEIYVQGDADVFPEIVATFSGSGSFYALANDEDFLMVGESPTVEQTVLPYEERVFWSEMDSTTGWSTWGGVPDAGVVTGTMASQGDHFRATDIGTGTEWHGPALVRSLTAPLQDFLVEFTATQISSNVKQVGRVELYLLDANSNTVAKLIMRDSDPNAYINYGFARVGQGSNQQYLIDHKSTRLNAFLRGKLRLRRKGRQFTANITRTDSKGKVLASVSGSYYDVRNEFQAPITQVVVHIAGFSTNPLSDSRVDDLKVFKLNEPAAPDSTVDQLFKSGDVLRLNGRSGLVTLNDGNVVGRLNPLSDWFTLKPGPNVLGVSTDALVRTDITYRSRWL